MNFVNLYQELNAAGVPLDSHESDLYCKATPEALAIVKASGYFHTYFKSNIDGDLWVEVPFAYYPFWEARAAK